MGHTLDAAAKPVFASTPTQTVADLQAAVDYAERVGGLLKVTSSQRTSLTASQTKPGWLISETDTGRVYFRTTTQPQGVLMFEDTGWTNITSFNNGFSSSTTSSELVRFRRKDGIVYLAGGLMRAAAPTTGVIAFGLPPGSRPGSQVRFTGRADIGMSGIIEVNGAVTLTATAAQPGPTGVGYALNGISFIAEN